VGGNAELVLEGATVGEVLRALETSWPRTAGWILDEQGSVRRHVNVFVGDRQVREDAAVGPQDRLVVLPSITGGALGA
jgi:molybdopterin synthase sulfur carrier subunit